MGVQCGRWDFEGKPIDPPWLDQVQRLLGRFGPDCRQYHAARGLVLVWCDSETNKPESIEQPMELKSGEVLIWDGRLDNRRELVHILGGSLPDSATDQQIVARAWERWRDHCFKRLVGDWALSLWNSRDRSVLLACDFLATRHLYYRTSEDGICWSTVPDPLLDFDDRDLTLDEEYLAGWLASFPAAHLTPYREIRRVPPASSVTIRPCGQRMCRYWEFDARKRIEYSDDRDYERHFLEVFRQSVKRRLYSSSPILAELSGGMDSSSIVFVADTLTKESAQPSVDTISYYDDREPHWNERPWFEKVEAHRGRPGLHIDLSLVQSVPQPDADAHPSFAPGGLRKSDFLSQYMERSRHRVLLSGIGGDEFVGGVPTPIPELENLLARGRLLSLARRLGSWSLAQRRPWIHLLRDTVAGFLPADLLTAHLLQSRASWLNPAFAKRHQAALAGYPKRWRLFGPLPSFQENLDALDGVRRQLASSSTEPFERRYPFLDRDLLEFLFAIPREQLVRPGERRCLMRRALRGIVPQEVLGRRRKAYVSGSPARLAGEHYDRLSAYPSDPMMSATRGIVDGTAFLQALDDARRGKAVPAIPLLRTAAIEGWLRALDDAGVLNVLDTKHAVRRIRSSCAATAQEAVTE